MYKETHCDDTMNYTYVRPAADDQPA